VLKHKRLQLKPNHGIIDRMFAVVKISGKQYRVSPQDIVDVDRVVGNEGDILNYTDVLLVDNEGKVLVGTPFVKDATVKATILKQFRGEKLHVRRYKSKVRYRKTTGFRASLTRLQIQSIG